MTSSSGHVALSNAREHSKYAVGYCLKFVRQEAWEIGSLYGSAIDAWYGAVHRHPGDRHPPVGAPMFYAGGKYGHIVVATDEAGQMRSTDCHSSGDVSEDTVSWPERAWGQTYLGWAEDLNGIDLPLEEEDDEMTEDDWKRMRSIVRDEVKDELNKQRPSYVSAFLAGEVSSEPETNVKKALRLSAEHARDKH